jgi:hypothetical protein
MTHFEQSHSETRFQFLECEFCRWVNAANEQNRIWLHEISSRRCCPAMIEFRSNSTSLPPFSSNRSHGQRSNYADFCFTWWIFVLETDNVTSYSETNAKQCSRCDQGLMGFWMWLYIISLLLWAILSMRNSTVSCRLRDHFQHVFMEYQSIMRRADRKDNCPEGSPSPVGKTGWSDGQPLQRIKKSFILRARDSQRSQPTASQSWETTGQSPYLTEWTTELADIQGRDSIPATQKIMFGNSQPRPNSVWMRIWSIGFVFEYSTFGNILVNELPWDHGNLREGSRKQEMDSNELYRNQWLISKYATDIEITDFQLREKTVKARKICQRSVFPPCSSKFYRLLSANRFILLLTWEPTAEQSRSARSQSSSGCTRRQLSSMIIRVRPKKVREKAQGNRRID